MEHGGVLVKTKEEYTTKQIKRILHNQQIILDMTRPHLKNKDLELLYTCANDSMCRLEGILHYQDTCELEEEDDVYHDGQALFHTPDGRTFTDAREADKHIQQLWKQEEED
jgi:hypothetical protein